MKTLLVGFDSAWTARNKGGLVGALRHENGALSDLGSPTVVSYAEARQRVAEWQDEWKADRTIVLLDQPTIVKNAAGQRPVENIVTSSISLRHGGMQPANTGRAEMFGAQAPLWPFLVHFGGPMSPGSPVANTCVVETYPALALIALRWMLPDSRVTGRFPKYNPTRKTFSPADWKHVCERTSEALRAFGLERIVHWIGDVAVKVRPSKHDQDCLDACLCLLVALEVADGKGCLMVGDLASGYIVVPQCDSLQAELGRRCEATKRVTADWVRTIRMP